ncbi:MAG: ubiquinone/menaquinone biosynthesis methyltransferase [Candidatus Dormibacteria bacterium]
MSTPSRGFQGPVRDPDRVRSMFDAISGRYDLANALMSLGRDSRWRSMAAELAESARAEAVLDCACGSGRLAEASLQAGAQRVVGLDFSPRMLAVARGQVHGVEFVEGDVLKLPYSDGEFDAVTIGFGLRNLPDPHAGIAEMTRVLKPGGRLVVLEAVRPTGILAPLLNLWVNKVIPRLGGVLSGSPAAYRYLGDTISTYASAPELGEWLRQGGLAAASSRRLMFGTVALARGIKPAP